MVQTSMRSTAKVPIAPACAEVVFGQQSNHQHLHYVLATIEFENKSRVAPIIAPIGAV